MRTSRPRKYSPLIIIAILAGLVQTGQTAAPHGVLDTGFDGDGKVTIPIGIAAAGQGVAVQPDGKVIVVGWSTPGQDLYEDFTVARLNRDGSLDTSFSGDGLLTVDFTNINGSRQDFATAVAIQPDGRIVVVGNSVQGTVGASDDFGIVRINPTGTLDSTFGDGGKTIVDFGFADVPESIAIQRNGKLVVAGSAGHAPGRDFAVIRLTAGGVPDGTFGSAGLLRVDFDETLAFDDVGRAVALSEPHPGGDATVLMAGSTGGGASPDNFFVARVTPGGTLDTSFGTGGKALIDFGASDQASAVALQPDGKVVVAGTSNHDFASRACSPTALPMQPFRPTASRWRRLEGPRRASRSCPTGRLQWADSWRPMPSASRCSRPVALKTRDGVHSTPTSQSPSRAPTGPAAWRFSQTANS